MPPEPLRLALVTTPEALDPSSRWASIMAALAEHCDLSVVVESGRESAGRSSAEVLRPRAHEQILFVLEDTPACAFMLPMIRAIGGTVYLPRWELPALAMAAHPELERMGLRGWFHALREGGPREALAWRRATARGERPSGLALNRSVVRHADSFLVEDAALAPRLLEERNERTPISVVEVSPEAGARWAEHLAGFPEPRAARRSLILARVREADRRRAAQRNARERR